MAFKCKIWTGIVLAIYILFVLLQLNDKGFFADAAKSFILPVITLIYFLTVKNKPLFFTLFLILYSISDLTVFVEPYMSFVMSYYIGNTLYILAYLFLVIEICKSISLFYIIKNFKIHMVVLISLNIYIGYVLQVVVNPYVDKANEYYVEIVYNFVMLALLSVSLLNYFYRDNVKALYLFLGSLCIVFAEVIWVAYTYISERNLLSIVSTTLYLVAFYFFYKQSKLEYEDNEPFDVLVN